MTKRLPTHLLSHPSRLLGDADSMYSRKRRRSPSSSSSSSSSHDEHAEESSRGATRGYFTLPAELQDIVLELVCCSPPPSIQSSSTNSPQLQRDTSSLASLSRVCRHLHYQVASLLWREVCITRPSSLYALHQALVADPERAKLISTLHIGPQDVLPAGWWPLRNRSGPQIGRGSSGYSQLWYERLPEEELYLSESESGRLWLLNGEPSGCQQVAVRDALYVAQRSLGVDLVREDFGVTLARQMEALFEVQAALDLYIGEITRIDEADKMQGLQKHRHCLASKCRHYPPLIVRDTPTRPQSFRVPDGAFLLHDTQLIRHLARRGACTDRFDHPLLFSRSGFDCDVRFPTELRTEAQVRYRLRRRDFSTMVLLEHLPWSKTPLLQEEDERVASSSASSKPLNSAVINTANLGSVLPLARAVLNLCTSVETVSLTGFLPHLLRGGLRVPNLRRVSLGPSLPNWNDQLTLNTLSHIEELRVSGWPLREDPIEIITRHMSRLKRLEWGRESKMSDRSQDG